MLGLNIGGAVVTVVSAHPPGVALPSMGSCTLGWEEALATVATLPSPKKLFFFGSPGGLVGKPKGAFGRCTGRTGGHVLG